MQELLNNPGLVKLGGEQVKLTVLFADIRGYTAYSEGKSPELMVEELNEVFTQINKKIFKNKGTLDKYLGDGVMAFFGAPLPIEEHSVNAVKTALEIMNLNLSFKLGIGINTGQAVAGNIGSRERMEYTVIGDSVNKAARFVEIAGPGEVIIGKSTYKSLSIDYKNRDWIKEMRKVRNINHETILYRLRGEDKIK
ncbi:MAG: adenylate/guanylate cyclase domain-containing protein [Halanaerobiales bacterium]